jgi:hypothetical protein
MASSAGANTISYLSGTKLAVASLIIGTVSLFTFLDLYENSMANEVISFERAVPQFTVRSYASARTRKRAPHNKSLDASGGSVFLNLIRAAMLE